MPMSASSARISVLGCYKVQIQIGHIYRHVNLLVCDNLSDPLILGRDALDTYGQWLYRPEMKDYFLNGSRLPLVDSFGKEEALEVFVDENVTVPPSCVQSVRLSVPRKLCCHASEIFVEPHPNFSSTALIPMRCVISREGADAAQVWYGRAPITLQRGQAFG